MERFSTVVILALLFICNLADNTQAEVSCREWTTPIRYQKKGNNIIVNFKEGPSKCDIKRYKVSIFHMNLPHLKAVASEITPNVTQEFLGICDGNYYITVEIFDEFWNDSKKCICKLYGGCNKCYRSRANNVAVIGTPCTTPSPKHNNKTSTKHKENSSKLTISLAIIGVMIILVLLALSFYCFKRTLQEKRGLLFYTEDHTYHCEAIDQFISFMNKSKCKLEVAARLVKGGDPLRLSLEIQKSDFIILVYSKALHKRIQAWKSNQDYINFLKEDNSALLTVSLLRELNASNKLIICKFPQVPNSSISSELPSIKCYTLTKELNSLIKKIHRSRVHQELAIRVKSNKLNHKFNSLTNTIKNAATFEENNSNWFEDKYICPKKMESLNEMPDYSANFSDGCERSIFSVPVSYMLEQINEYNDSSV
ncbi:Hypothetical predicted protein [Octopus vulgaris]|nr:Hypothetical predicted protein [Octopus vulgaris]